MQKFNAQSFNFLPDIWEWRKIERKNWYESLYGWNLFIISNNCILILWSHSINHFIILARASITISLHTSNLYYFINALYWTQCIGPITWAKYCNNKWLQIVEFDVWEPAVKTHLAQSFVDYSIIITDNPFSDELFFFVGLEKFHLSASIVYNFPGSSPYRNVIKHTHRQLKALN